MAALHTYVPETSSDTDNNSMDLVHEYQLSSSGFIPVMFFPFFKIFRESEGYA